MRGLVFAQVGGNHGNKAKYTFSNRINGHTPTNPILIHHSTILNDPKKIEDNSSNSLIHNSIPVDNTTINKIVGKGIHHIANGLAEGYKDLNEDAELELDTDDG